MRFFYLSVMYAMPLFLPIYLLCLWMIVAVKSLNCVQLFCDSMDCSPLGSSLHGISQARILEQVAISFSKGSSQSGDQTASPASAGRFSTTGPPGKPIFVPIKWAQSIKRFVHIVLGHFFILVLFDIYMLMNFVHFCMYIHFVCTYN